ncbi:hypothetical protein [Sansalvadorimonas verongulae]|nr:hypothetical protein [Sansalvadorimonas verongulae]
MSVEIADTGKRFVASNLATDKGPVPYRGVNGLVVFREIAM